MNYACTVCGKEFPYYKGKLYCSNSCKTKGHKLKKEGVELQLPIAGFNQERTSFYLSDYDSLRNKEFCSFIHYCFLIKNFAEFEDLTFINNYVDTIICGNEFENDLKNEKSPMKKKVLEFEEIYHSGRYTIKNDRP
jgi:hypothetical protein